MNGDQKNNATKTQENEKKKISKIKNIFKLVNKQKNDAPSFDTVSKAIEENLNVFLKDHLQLINEVTEKVYVLTKLLELMRHMVDTEMELPEIINCFKEIDGKIVQIESLDEIIACNTSNENGKKKTLNETYILVINIIYKIRMMCLEEKKIEKMIKGDEEKNEIEDVENEREMLMKKIQDKVDCEESKNEKQIIKGNKTNKTSETQINSEQFSTESDEFCFDNKVDLKEIKVYDTFLKTIEKDFIKMMTSHVSSMNTDSSNTNNKYISTIVDKLKNIPESNFTVNDILSSLKDVEKTLINNEKFEEIKQTIEYFINVDKHLETEKNNEAITKILITVIKLIFKAKTTELNESKKLNILGEKDFKKCKADFKAQRNEKVNFFEQKLHKYEQTSKQKINEKVGNKSNFLSRLSSDSDQASSIVSGNLETINLQIDEFTQIFSTVQEQILTIVQNACKITKIWSDKHLVITVLTKIQEILESDANIEGTIDLIQQIDPSLIDVEKITQIGKITASFALIDQLMGTDLIKLLFIKLKLIVYNMNYELSSLYIEQKRIFHVIKETEAIKEMEQLEEEKKIKCEELKVELDNCEDIKREKLAQQNENIELIAKIKDIFVITTRKVIRTLSGKQTAKENEEDKKNGNEKEEIIENKSYEELGKSENKEVNKIKES